MYFPANAPLADPVYFRTYARFHKDGSRETWPETCKRVYDGLVSMGKVSPEYERQFLQALGYTPEQVEDFYRQLDTDSLLYSHLYSLYALPSGRNLWVAGTEWSQRPENYYGLYNCCSRNIENTDDIAVLFDLLCQGSGTGANLELVFLEPEKAPFICHRLSVEIQGSFGAVHPGYPKTTKYAERNSDNVLQVTIRVGDSREGWVEAYRSFMRLATSDTELPPNVAQGVSETEPIHVVVDISHVRKQGARIKGFGGRSNPSRLPDLFINAARYLNNALDSRLDSVTACLLLNEAGLAVVAGNVRRCLPEDTPIDTDKGAVPIKDIQVGDLVQTPIGLRKVLNVFRQGYQQTWEFMLESGTALRCTDRHRNAVIIKDSLQYRILRIAGKEPETPCRYYPEAVWSPAIFTYTGDYMLRNTPDGLVPDLIVHKRLHNLVPVLDIEVEEAHCFFANGVLTHNSANIQIGNYADQRFKVAKDNLWEQKPDGSWVIDPDRDAMRMANLSRVFHHKPTYEEVLEAVTKQYESGEGAILYANESIARCNADLWHTRSEKLSFIRALDEGQGEAWIREHYPQMPYPELRHRLLRYGTNPCFVGETFVATHKGVRQIKDIVGKDVTVWTGSEWVNTRFRQTEADSPLVEITLYSGLTVTCTPEHKFFLLGLDQTKHADELVKGDVLHWTPLYANTSPETGQRALMLADKDSNVTEEDAYVWGYERQFDADTLQLVFTLGSPYQLSFLAGFYDAFGSYLGAGKNLLPTYDVIMRSDDEAQVVQTLLQLNRIYSIRRLDPETRRIRVRCAGIHALSIAVRLPLKRLQRDTAIPMPDIPTSIDKYFTVRRVRNLDTTAPVYCCTVEDTHRFTLANQLVVHNCGEVIGSDFMCSLSDVHLIRFVNTPWDLTRIKLAFIVSALMNASHLHQNFHEDRFRYSREIDPITQVTFTGAVDYFVALFGQRWLEWWQAGRPHRWGKTVQTLDYIPLSIHKEHDIAGYQACESLVFLYLERTLLSQWKEVVERTISLYCKQQNLRCPTRFTGHQPAGCTDLLQVRNLDQGLLYYDEAEKCSSRSVRGIPSLLSFTNTYQPLRLVVFRNGRQIYFTRNHRIQMHNTGEWKCAKDLQPGDVCFHVLGNYTSKFPHVTRQEDGDVYAVQHLNVITAPVARFLAMYWVCGYSYGEGEDTIWFTTKREHAFKVLSDAVKELFQIKLKLNNRSNKVFEASITFPALARWLERTGVAKLDGNAIPDRIPTIVRKSSAEAIIAFIGAVIEMKGRLNKDRKVTVAFSNWSTLSCFQQCAEAVGIPLLIEQPVKPSIHYHKNPAWRLIFQERNTPWGVDELLREYSPLYKGVQGKAQSGPFNPFLYEVQEVRDLNEVEAEIRNLRTWDITVDAMDEDNGAWYFTGALNSHNTKSLLTGSSPGIHLPKGQYFIRRVTFAVNDPVALACQDYGYKIVPGQGSTDANGKLLDDPYDPRVKEWLVEIPTKVSWADTVAETDIDIASMPFDAQWDFYMQNQKHWTTFNTSATLELTREEIPIAARCIFEAIHSDEGYISAALLARFNDSETFPRLPFEPIDAGTYHTLVAEVEQRRKTSDFSAALREYDLAVDEANRNEGLGGMACDSDKCLISGGN